MHDLPSKHTTIILLRSSFAYAALYIVQFSMMFFHLRFTSEIVRDLFLLGMLLLPFIPFLWLFQIRIIWLRNVTLALYGLIFLPLMVIESLGIVFVLMIVLSSMFGYNGDRPVFEKALADNKRLIIYRTTDQGALGGDNIVPAIIEDICPGIERVNWLYERDIIFDAESDSNYVVIEGIIHRVPKEEELRKRGNL